MGTGDRQDGRGVPTGVVLLALAVAGLPLLLSRATPAFAQVTQTVITGPPGSSAFGSRVAYLPSGDYLVVDPDFDLPGIADVGAVHLYRGSDDVLVASLTGSTASDHIGKDGGTEPGVRVLPDGNYLVRAPEWDRPSPAAIDAGAVVWCSGVTGCSGVVSAANAVVGSSENDVVGRSVRVLANGNYVVYASSWNDPSGPVPGAGAVRFCEASTGCFGPITAQNALVGSSSSDFVVSEVVPLPSGDYLVAAPTWNDPLPSPRNDVGAVTFCSGTTGCVGAISATNSLVGATTGDGVGSPVVLTDGSYVVLSPSWNDGLVVDAGAVTWCNGTTGCAPGPVTAANSLVGANAGDSIGKATRLPDGAYAVNSFWVDQPGGFLDVGALRWCAAGGIGCAGSKVTPANSLLGALPGDLHDLAVVPVGVTGAFAAAAPYWDSLTTTYDPDVGRVVFCNATTHCLGEAATVANSLIGSTAGDKVGLSLVALSNGNYVVGSKEWNDGPIADVGAATFCSGTTGCQGPVTTANSLTGSTAGDRVGTHVTALANGNYVVKSGAFDVGASVDVGVVRHCSGTTGCTGTPSALDSLVGAMPGDAVGSFTSSPDGGSLDPMGITTLPNGDYLVRSPLFDGSTVANVGALTRCSGASGCVGTVGLGNSLLGTLSQDQVGGGLVVFPSGHHVVMSRRFSVFTFGDPTAALVGPVDASNSLFGAGPFDLFSLDYDAGHDRYLVGRMLSNRVVVVAVPEPGPVAGLSACLLALARAGSSGRRARRRVVE